MIEELVFPKVYEYSEVLESCLAYFKGDELAATTWMNKYAVKTKKGEYLEVTPAQMHKRMAVEFGRIEKHYEGKEISVEGLSDYGKTRKFLSEDDIFDLFKDFKYIIPQGSVMSSLGNENVIASLSNCVVVPPVYDSYGGIFHTDEQLAQLFKRRCGVGVDLSNLRPRGAQVSNSAGSTTGAVSFMDRFSNTMMDIYEKV